MSEKPKKGKKEKTVYIDDGRSLADMSVLDTARIAAIKGIDIAPWQERLKEIISLINR